LSIDSIADVLGHPDTLLGDISAWRVRFNDAVPKELRGAGASGGAATRSFAADCISRMTHQMRAQEFR